MNIKRRPFGRLNLPLRPLQFRGLCSGVELLLLEVIDCPHEEPAKLPGNIRIWHCRETLIHFTERGTETIDQGRTAAGHENRILGLHMKWDAGSGERVG